MPSRFTIVAMGLAAPLLLAACEQEAQQPAEVEQTQEPQTAETETPEPTAPEPEAPPAAEGEQQTAAEDEPPAGTEPGAPPAPQTQGAGEDGEIAVIPPEEEAETAGGQETAQAQEPQPDAQAQDTQPGADPQDRQPAAQAPGEPSPEAQGVASVAAYVGRWAEDEMMCPRSYWTFTNLRLQSPNGVSCDIGSASEQENGVGLEVACTRQEEPLAEPERGTMTLTFPNLPETDTMTVAGGPLEDEELTLRRCPLG